MSTASNKPRVSIIDAPFGGGQPKDGARKGPEAIHNAGLDEAIAKAGWEVSKIDIVNAQPRTPETRIKNFRNPHYVGSYCNDLHTAVRNHINAGHLCLVLGGDHSIGAGSIAGVLEAKPDVFIVWVDAHADINTSVTSPSGNMHGMPVAILANICGEVPGFEWMKNDAKFDLSRVAYIGLRDVDDGEKEIMEKYNVMGFYMEDIKKSGIESVVQQILDRAGSRPIHLSFDIDALDPKAAPATGTPVHDGLTITQGEYVCRTLAATGRLTSMDLVEVNPDLAVTPADLEQTCRSAVQLVVSVLEGANKV